MPLISSKLGLQVDSSNQHIIRLKEITTEQFLIAIIKLDNIVYKPNRQLCCDCGFPLKPNNTRSKQADI